MGDSRLEAAKIDVVIETLDDIHLKMFPHIMEQDAEKRVFSFLHI